MNKQMAELKAGPNKDMASSIIIPKLETFKKIIKKVVDSNKDGKFSKDELTAAFEEILKDANKKGHSIMK